jgi:hypothetical protein
MSWIKDLEDREIPYSLVRMMTNGNSIRNFGTDQNCTQRMDFLAPCPECPESFGSQQISALHVQCFTCGYGSIPINTIFSGMNIHKSQLFWCSPGVQGFDPCSNRHVTGLESWALSLATGYRPQFRKMPKGVVALMRMPFLPCFRIHGAQLAVLSSRAQGLKDESTLW